VNTVNSSVQVQGAFQGSTPVGVATKDPLPLSLDDAVSRALSYNLGVIGAVQTEQNARAQRLGALAELLPDILGTASENAEQLVLSTTGLQSARVIPGIAFARTLGPFNFFQSGVLLSQRVMDLTAYRNYRSSKEIAYAARANVRDSRELVILAVGGFYLQTVAAAARVDSARAQLETAQALYKQAVDRYQAGVNARIDANRSEVEMQTQRLRVISLETDFKTQKLTLGRLIGLPLGQDFTLTTVLEYPPVSPMPLDEALEKAFATRPDLQAARAQVRAAVQARKAAQAQYTPAISITGSYFVAGVNPGQSNGMFSAGARVDFPIWRSGRIQSDVAEADAVLAQRQAEFEDACGRVDYEVRTAFLRLNAATEQVGVAASSRTLAQETVRQARDRFEAGVANTVEVVQAQEAVAVAEQDYISAVYAHYLAALTLARATGDAEQGLANMLRRIR
jgi:outer membrane protein TolC